MTTCDYCANRAIEEVRVWSNDDSDYSKQYLLCPRHATLEVEFARINKQQWASELLPSAKGVA